MTITLDTATEERIRHELARGRFADVNELIGHAMELVEAEDESEISDAGMEDWLIRNCDAVRAGVAESFAAKERGESYSQEEAEVILAQRRAARTPHAA